MVSLSVKEKKKKKKEKDNLVTEKSLPRLGIV